MRKYDVDEIDQMRASVTAARAWIPGQPKETVEDELRTYMLAGVTPAELDERTNAKKAAYLKDAQDKRAVNEADGRRRAEIRSLVREELERTVPGIFNAGRRDFYGNPITTVADVAGPAQRRGFFR